MTSRAHSPPRADAYGGCTLPRQHGVQQGPQTPDVTGCVVALPLQDLDGGEQTADEHLVKKAQGQSVIFRGDRERGRWETGGYRLLAPSLY